MRPAEGNRPQASDLRAWSRSASSSASPMISCRGSTPKTARRCPSPRRGGRLRAAGNPRRRKGGYAERMLGACERSVKQGRVRGIAPCFFTQRPASLKKTVLSQIDSLVVMRLLAPQNREAISKYNGTTEQLDELPTDLATLPTGHRLCLVARDARAVPQGCFPRVRDLRLARPRRAGRGTSSPLRFQVLRSRSFAQAPSMCSRAIAGEGDLD